MMFLRSVLGAVVAAALGATCGGCAGEPFSELARRSPSAMTLPLAGTYDVTIQAPFSGALTARFYARASEPGAPEGFDARTHEGVAWELIGGIAGVFGPIFVPSLFPDGVILQWRSAVPTDAGPGEGTTGVPGLESLRARTRLRAADAPVEVLSRDGRRIGLMTVAPASEGPPGGTDYTQLAGSIDEAIRGRLFDPAMAGSPGVRAYTRRLHAVGWDARDDAEFVFGAVLAARAHLKITTPIMWRRGDPRLTETFASWPERERATVRLESVEGEAGGRARLAVVKSDAFLDAAEVDRVMRAVVEADPEALILDLRVTPGVTLASLRVLAWLIDRPLDAGTFVGPGKRGAVLHGTGAGIPEFQLDSPGAVAELERVLEREGAARVIVEPVAKPFAGPVFAAVSRRTSASAEPLVWLLKSTARGTIVGGTTAGKPMISAPLDAGQGWLVWLAAYDYVPPDGPAARFNGRGVKPDVVSRDAIGEARRRAGRGAK